ncbi:30S ribosome-binding factor RbfA [Anaerotalea alkaliphila]|uniref:Ribosome-binding factor A n=1 Tax=Anaerotalea alkaliphila TaxID=2662126 RepID=A0A7X5HTF6_9FIRM|nr:30S ribosome-binding factor RbfA [Anaerotalea alkaliphila]NDL66321.1 30S ribosome-binding factor RbfA [Anaerotalea alkaliphila]
MKKISNRMIRINEEMKHALADIIRNELKDPRVDKLTSVLRVETTQDLSYCKVYVSLIGDDEAQKATLEGLKSSAGFIRKELARRVNLRNTPQVQFSLDHSIEYGVHISKLIDDVNKPTQEQEQENT